MKKVTQVIPKEQVKIIVESLTMMELALSSLKDKGIEEINYKLFDLHTLKAILTESEVEVKLPFEKYEKFSSITGVDFPIYINEEV